MTPEERACAFWKERCPHNHFDANHCQICVADCIREAASEARAPLLEMLRETLSDLDSIIGQVEDACINDCGICRFCVSEGLARKRVKRIEVAISGEPEGLRAQTLATVHDDLPLGHAFKAAPFYPDICDVQFEEDGRRRVCARTQREHHSVRTSAPDSKE